DLVPIPFELRDSLEDTIRTLASRAHGKGLELACHIPPEVPDELVGDPVRLRQIIVNLVGNAIKFTHEGEVVVDVMVDGGSGMVDGRWLMVDGGQFGGDRSSPTDTPPSTIDHQPSTINHSPSTIPTAEVGLHFVVSDTGIGIPEEKQRSIFESFTQA